MEKNIKHWAKKMRYLAKTYHIKGYDKADLYQELCIKLFKLSSKIDVLDKDNYNYVYTSLINTLRNAVRKSNNKKQIKLVYTDALHKVDRKKEYKPISINKLRKIATLVCMTPYEKECWLFYMINNHHTSDPHETAFYAGNKKIIKYFGNKERFLEYLDSLK